MNATNRPAAWIRNVVPVVLAPEGKCWERIPYTNEIPAGFDGRRSCAGYPRSFDGCAPPLPALVVLLATA